MDESFRAKLITAADPKEMYEVLVQEDAKKSEDADVSQARESAGKYLVGISACMTGIAHTYMAAEALANEAKKRGMRVKIQTNGSTGVENRLTSKDVEEADAIVVAHDVKVDTTIFGEKPFLDVPVKRAIDKPDLVVDQALEEDAITSQPVQSHKNLESALGKEKKAEEDLTKGANLPVLSTHTL